MRRFSILYAVLATAALAVTGCGGSSPKVPAAQAGAVSASTGASASASAAPAAAGSAAPHASGQASSSAVAATTAAQQGATQHAASGGGGAQPGALPPTTKPGHYTYAASGTTKSPLGAKDVNGTATLTVDPPSGHQQHQALSSPDMSQEQTLLSQTGGYYLVSLKFSAQGFTEEFHASPPVLFLPVGAPAGKSWSWQLTSTDGKYTVHTTSKIVRSEKQKTTGGTALDTTLVHSVVTVSGSGIQFTDTQDDWFSPAYGLLVKEHAVMHGTGYGQTFDSDVTRTLESTQPK